MALAIVTPTPVTCKKQCRQEALSKVKVPIEVRQLLADLRTHLREKIEPPVYVSDRRLVKAVGLMQVTMLTLNAAAVCLLSVITAVRTGSRHFAAPSAQLSVCL